MKKLLFIGFALFVALTLMLGLSSCGESETVDDEKPGETVDKGDENTDEETKDEENDSTDEGGENTDEETKDEENESTDEGGENTDEETKDEENDSTDEGDENNPTEEHTHNFGEWITVKAPTCTTDGAKERECACGEKENATISKDTVNHTPADAVVEDKLDSTCKLEGSYNLVVYCSVCETKLSSEVKSIDKKEHTEVTDAAVEPTFTSTGLTEGKHCSVCEEVLVAQDIIPMLPSKTTLTAETLTVNGRDISGKFSYATEIFNFVNDIKVTNNSPWVVSIDSFGMHTVVTKTVPLAEGNNTFYIHVTNPDQTVSTYTVNIYRNHLYKVSFNVKGGTSVAEQYIEEGYLAEEPTTSRAGYTFDSWDFSFDTPITSNITINANWFANTDTAYKVEYYLENADKNGYELLESESENLTGITDTTAYAKQKQFKHFTLDTYNSTLSGNIAGNGSLVLRVYYTRSTYTVSTSKNNTQAGTVVGSGTYPYDTEITLTAATNPGYTFLGWYEGEEKVCDSLTYTFNVDHTATYTAKWSANTDTAYKVEYYLENVDKSGYELLESESENLIGITDTIAYAEQKQFEHFTLNTNRSTLSGNIAGNGSLVLHVYYTRNTYTVSTSINDAKAGTVVGSDTYPYNAEITLTAATNPGYTFLGWYEGEEKVCDTLKYTFNVDRTATYTAQWSANTDTAYNVEYYLENVGKNGYEDPIVVNLAGTTDTSATAEEKTFEHFTFDSAKSVMSGNIAGNRSLVLRVYYTRNTYTVSTSINDTKAGSVIGSGAHPYDAEITLTAATNPGYTFLGWYEVEEKVCESLTYTIKVMHTATYVARFGVAEEMANFEFTSTATTYTITGIKDNSVTEIIVPDYVTTIGDHAFASCYRLTSVEIGDSVTTIDAYAFSGCTSLTSVVIGDSVTQIGNGAFDNCTILTSVVIPDSVTTIGYETFRYCEKLVEVINKSSLNITAGSKDNGYVAYYAIEVHSGESKIVNYNDYLFYTYNGVNYLFGYVGTDTELTLPESYNGEKYEIYKYAFLNCDSLTSVEIPDSVTTIGFGAFESCNSLTSVVIGDSVTTIGDFAFYYCTSLTSVDIPDSVTIIGDYAFYSCDSLTSVVIGDSVTTIGYMAFAYCDSLTSVVIGDSVTTIGEYAFAWCESLSSIKCRAQWSKISKGYGWNYNTGSYTITYNYSGN